MRNLFFALIILISTNSYCQSGKPKIDTLQLPRVLIANPLSCDNLISITEDKVTGAKIIVNKDIFYVSNDGKSSMNFILQQLGNGFTVISILCEGASPCIDKGSKINILFTDGSRMEMKTMSDFNCKGEASVYYLKGMRNVDEFQQLKTKKIETIRVWTRDGYVQEDFSKNNQETFAAIIDCLLQ